MCFCAKIVTWCSAEGRGRMCTGVRRSMSRKGRTSAGMAAGLAFGFGSEDSTSTAEEDWQRDIGELTASSQATYLLNLALVDVASIESHTQAGWVLKCFVILR